LVLPKTFLLLKELALDENDRIAGVDRAPGSNAFGMVAWLFTFKMPECPEGRQAVVIANDTTFKIGSFGPVEDQVFYLVTRYAREQGIPRIYLSANSGARLGLAEEVMPLFSCAWNDDGNPDKGISYLYLTPLRHLPLWYTDTCVPPGSDTMKHLVVSRHPIQSHVCVLSSFTHSREVTLSGLGHTEQDFWRIEK